MDPAADSQNGKHTHDRQPPEPASLSPHGVFLSCPQCDSQMLPEHAHFRCRQCGWRDSCCD